MYVYVLSCTDKCFYVGKSRNLVRRMEDHQTAQSKTQWLALHPPIELVSCKPAAGIWDEDMTTLEYMRVHGVEFVRGGTFTAVSLHPNTCATIANMTDTALDRCFNCHQRGHFSHDCSASSSSSSAWTSSAVSQATIDQARAVFDSEKKTKTKTKAKAKPKARPKKKAAASSSGGGGGGRKRKRVASSASSCSMCGGMGHWDGACVFTAK